MNAILLHEARQWIADVFEDAPKRLTNAEVINGISRHYAGGWSQFTRDMEALLD